MVNENCDVYDNASDAVTAIKATDDTKFQACVPYMEAGKWKFLVIYKT